MHHTAISTQYYQKDRTMDIITTMTSLLWNIKVFSDNVTSYFWWNNMFKTFYCWLYVMFNVSMFFLYLPLYRSLYYINNSKKLINAECQIFQFQKCFLFVSMIRTPESICKAVITRLWWNIPSVRLQKHDNCA